MWLHDNASCPPVNDTLVALAENLGVDRTHAHDVVGAVFSFCRARHGTTELPDHYLAFLTARSVCGFQGVSMPPDYINAVRSLRIPRESMMLRALAASADPASLYEAGRRKLVALSSSSLSARQHAIQVNLRKIIARPEENLSFIWLSVYKRVADWICDWRAGNPELDTVLVSTGNRRLKSDGEDQRELLETALRGLESRRNLASARLVWAS